MVDAVYFSDFAELDISIGSIPARAAENLLAVLTGGHTDVLYIEVGLLPTQRLELGHSP